MENKLLKVGDEVYFTNHTYSGRRIGEGIGTITSVLGMDYYVRCANKNSYMVTIPGKRQGGHSLDTISLIEEEN